MTIWSLFAIAIFSHKQIEVHMVKKPVKTVEKPPRRNMRAAERERLILDEAIKFFAEHGFGGQTRELAKRMGITHSAIYRHFPSKEALIERVYEEIYLSRWSPSWAGLIQDRSLTLEARLSQRDVPMPVPVAAAQAV